MKCHSTHLFLLLALLVFPQHAMANAGTPLMWAGMLHLVFGNALIGVGEGLLLVWLFKTSIPKSVLVMIAANYFSAWFGGLYIGAAIVRELPLDLNNGWRWFWIMVVATYCMTLVLEWPFIAWCFRGAQDWWRRSLKATLVTQSASYIVLFGWYWMASGTSLYTQMNIVKPADLSLPESVLVYFIDPADGNAYRSHLSGTDRQKVYELHSTNSNDRLFARPNAADSNRWDLAARLGTTNINEAYFVNILTNLNVEATSNCYSFYADSIMGTWRNFGRAQKLGSATNSQWQFESGVYPIEGLLAKNTSTTNKFRFAYETPFGQWRVRNAVHLPSDIVLFQLGEDQICVFDPENKKVALLWHGRGPVPVIEKHGVAK
jgi:hypothetical protein